MQKKKSLEKPLPSFFNKYMIDNDIDYWSEKYKYAIVNRAVHRPKPVQNFVIRAGFFILFFEPGR